MQLLRAVFVVVAVVLTGAPAFAQAPTPQEYESVMRWAAGQQQIISATVSPLQQIPPPINVDAGRTERAAWVSLARNWANGYRVTLQSTRQQIAQLGPVPEAGEISAPYRRQEEALPTMIDGLESFLSQYERGIAAVERNDPTALQIASVNAVDAQILVLTQFRNLNALQAESISDGPQRYLLRSFASSYDGLIAILRARRSAYLGDNLSPATQATVQAAAEAMRQHSREGRASADRAAAQLPVTAPPEQGDFLRRVRLAYQTYGGSFDREEAIAGLLERAAALLGAGRAFAEVEVELDQHVIRVGELDFERVADIQRRTALVQTMVPPT